MSENHAVNKCFSKKLFFYIWNYTVVVPLTQIIHPMFNRGKEMVKDVIAVIHDCIKKFHVIFLINYIKRELVWWKKTQFDGPG